MREATTVTGISGNLDQGFTLEIRCTDGEGKATTARIAARTVIGAQGKRSSFDRTLKRRFLTQPQPFIGLKAHFRGPPLTGRIDLHTFVDACSTQSAKLFGLFPRKGTIALGSDADLVIYDPNYRGRISAKTQQMNVDYSAFEGWDLEGRPATVTVRGKVQVSDGKFVGELGHGQFLKRQPTHF